jgi:hypothetical protein
MSNDNIFSNGERRDHLNPGTPPDGDSDVLMFGGDSDVLMFDGAVLPSDRSLLTNTHGPPHDGRVISWDFPAGSGDCQIESSEGEVSYFPGVILREASPPFRHHYDKGQRQFTLPLSSNLVSLLLHFLHPRFLRQAPLNVTQIEPLLGVASAYDLVGIYRWVREEVNRKPESLIERYPSEILVLSVRFRLDDLAEQAVRIRIQQGPLTDADCILGMGLYRSIDRQKQNRIRLYMNAIEFIEGYEPDYWQDRGEERVLQCRDCSYQRSRWVLEMVKVVTQMPAWNAFNSVAHGAGCSKVCQRQVWATEVYRFTTALQLVINEIDSNPVQI